MNLRMALFTKSYQTTQMFQFMSDNRHTAYLVGFMMNLQIIGLATHPGHEHEPYVLLLPNRGYSSNSSDTSTAFLSCTSVSS